MAVPLSVRTSLMAMVLIAFASTCFAAHIDPNASTFTFFAWRSLGYQSNGAPHVKVRAFLGSDGTPGVGETGQAEQGWHELHPAPGPQTATFEEGGDAYPTFAGPVMVGSTPEEWAVFDIPIYWLYEPDNLVWGQGFVRQGQTFKAAGEYLDKVSAQIAGGAEDLVAVIREGGPDGEQVGPAAKFASGPGGDGTRTGWIIARWEPATCPMEIGKTYYIDITSESGKVFNPRMHSTGNIYPDGCAYFDGVPDPMSDLGLFFSFERDDVIRSKVLYTHDGNWVRKAKGVYFRARSENIRGIWTEMWFPNTPFHVSVLFRVHKVDQKGDLVNVGVDKQGYNFTSPGGTHYVAAVYAADEMPLEVGGTYYLELVPSDKELPEDPALLPKMDLNVRIYGEKTAGMVPVIYNQHVVETTPSHIKLEWKGTTDGKTTIHYGLDPYKLNRVLHVPDGVQTADVGPITPATTVSFRMVTESKLGGKFETPVYQARTRDAANLLVVDPPLLAPPQHEFLSQCIGFINLAVMDRMYQPPLPKAREVRKIEIVNPGFEQALNGWTAEDVVDIKCSDTAKSGDLSVGWDLTFNQGGDSHRQETVYQKVKVTPGKTYKLSASLYTLQEGHGDNFYARFNSGDVKARLVCDPAGGTDFKGHSTQWFRTGGRWLEFTRKFKAESDEVTIGVGFYRVHDWNQVVALADDVRLVEVAE